MTCARVADLVTSNGPGGGVQRSHTPTADMERMSRSRSPADALSQEVDGFTRHQQQQHSYANQDGYSANFNRSVSSGGGVGAGGDLSSRSFSQHDRGGDVTSSSRYRSRTPGPDFMRSRERDDEQYFAHAQQQQRGRDTARSIAEFCREPGR